MQMKVLNLIQMQWEVNPKRINPKKTNPKKTNPKKTNPKRINPKLYLIKQDKHYLLLTI